MGGGDTGHGTTGDTSIHSNPLQSLGIFRRGHTLKSVNWLKLFPVGERKLLPEGHFWAGWRQLVKDQHFALKVEGGGA